MIEAISREGDWRAAIFDSSQSILQPLGASGSALIYEGQVITTVKCRHPEIREIGAWLDTRPRVPVFSTASLGSDAPEFERDHQGRERHCRHPDLGQSREFLIWVSSERIRTVTWAAIRCHHS